MDGQIFHTVVLFGENVVDEAFKMVRIEDEIFHVSPSFAEMVDAFSLISAKGHPAAVNHLVYHHQTRICVPLLDFGHTRLGRTEITADDAGDAARQFFHLGENQFGLRGQNFLRTDIQVGGQEEEFTSAAFDGEDAPGGVGELGRSVKLGAGGVWCVAEPESAGFDQFEAVFAVVDGVDAAFPLRETSSFCLVNCCRDVERLSM